MLPSMKTIALAAALLATLAIAGCGDDARPSHGEYRDSHQRAASEGEKSFDKENPANPGQFSENK